uniref:Putative HNH endonuclease n=1 Tax=viral metagenome TaxID=1070528 RepID=A0A6M3IVU0_9ZZZZ
MAYCQCGCGAEIDDSKTFLWGHNQKGVKHPYVKRGEENPNWKGGKPYLNTDGYFVRNVTSGSRLVHREIAEKILRRSLPEKSVVHHVNGKPADNFGDNFVVCEDNTYHALLHKRTRAFKACGHADWLRCYLCKEYDNPENIKKGERMQYHLRCTRKYYWDKKIKKGKEKEHETAIV